MQWRGVGAVAKDVEANFAGGPVEAFHVDADEASFAQLVGHGDDGEDRDPKAGGDHVLGGFDGVELHGGFGDDAGAQKHAIDHVVVGGAALEEEEGLGAGFEQGHGLSAGEGVAGRDHQAEVVVEQVGGLDLRVSGEAADGEVDFAGQQVLDDVFAGAGAHADVDAGALGVEALQDAGKDVGAEAGAGTHSEAADLSVAHRLDGLGAFLDGGEGALGVGEEGAAGVGKDDAAAGALEEALAQLAFQGLDACGDGRLG